LLGVFVAALALKACDFAVFRYAWLHFVAGAVGVFLVHFPQDVGFFCG